MITDRLFAWARVQPDKPALLWNDMPLSYAAFARAIEASRRFLAREDLPPGRTAIVLLHNLSDAWVAVLALRALGLTTVGLTGMGGGKLKELVDVPLVVPSNSMQHIEDVHLLVCHLLTAYLRDEQPSADR